MCTLVGANFRVIVCVSQFASVLALFCLAYTYLTQGTDVC